MCYAKDFKAMPSYSVVTTTTKLPIAAMMKGPGPAKYGLPSCLGHPGHDIRKSKSPAFSFGRRLKTVTSSDSPGPAYMFPARMTRQGGDGAPAYSLHGRPKMAKPLATPAPGHYRPERRRNSASGYSFGMRTKTFTHDSTPSPSAYTIPSYVGSGARSSAPAYSMTGRSKIGSFHEDLRRTPGPGSYKTIIPSVYKYKSPTYSMNGRNYLPNDATKKPGPGTYTPEKVVVNRDIAPKFSFGVRHSEYMAMMPACRE